MKEYDTWLEVQWFNSENGRWLVLDDFEHDDFDHADRLQERLAGAFPDKHFRVKVMRGIG